MRERKLKDFFIDEFLGGSGEVDAALGGGAGFNPQDSRKMREFLKLCERIKLALEQDFKLLKDSAKQEEANMQKNAITGDQKAGGKLRSDIQGKLTMLNLLSEEFPGCYRDLTDAVFHELFGLSSLAAWANDYTPEYARSSSAKIIGDEIYCLIDGKSVLQPQRLPKERRDQLRQALLMAYPKENIAKGHNEVYLKREDGNIIRATLLSDKFTQKGKDAMVFRKYLLSDADNLQFEVLSGYGTFPQECCDLFRNMVKCGYNVIMSGEVRSGKTTFLQTYQHYEDPTLEATTVSTDEETDYSKVTKGPLIQIIADEDDLKQMEKTLKRLDSNYIIMSEMRTAMEYKFYLGITNMGTRRCKCTIHDNDAASFPRKMATEVVSSFGGDLQATIAQIYTNVDFVFEMFEVPTDRSKKRLKGIVEFRYDKQKDLCLAHRLCKYDAETDSWRWNSDVGKDKKDLAIGYMENFHNMQEILKSLEEKSPLTEGIDEYPSYYAGNAKVER